MTDTVITSREVIENKILTALVDADKVAIVASEDDLQIVIRALTLLAVTDSRANSLLNGARQLQQEAFGHTHS